MWATVIACLGCPPVLGLGVDVQRGQLLLELAMADP